jgi:hypothetical protein
MPLAIELAIGKTIYQWLPTFLNRRDEPSGVAV